MQKQTLICSLFNYDEFDYLLYETGYSKPLSSLTAQDKQDIVSSVTNSLHNKSEDRDGPIHGGTRSRRNFELH